MRSVILRVFWKGVHRLATAPIRRSHSSRLPRKPSSQAVTRYRTIVRAIGPELTQYGVPNVLNDPTLELHDSTGRLIARNDDWQHTIIGRFIGNGQVRDIIASGLAPADGRESAMVVELPAGNYTAIVRGVNNTTGVGLVESNDLD